MWLSLARKNESWCGLGWQGPLEVTQAHPWSLPLTTREDPGPEDLSGFLQGSSGPSCARCLLQGAFHIIPHLERGGFLLMFGCFPPGCFFPHTLLLWEKCTWMYPQCQQMSLSPHVLSVWEGIKSRPVNNEICLHPSRLSIKCEALQCSPWWKNLEGKPHGEQLRYKLCS